MKVRGTVTRVVEGAGGAPGQVFFRPIDPGDLRKVEGSHLTASGEVALKVEGDSDHEVGKEAEFEVTGADEAAGDDAGAEHDEDDEDEPQPPAAGPAWKPREVLERIAKQNDELLELVRKMWSPKSARPHEPPPATPPPDEAKG
jgi:hypothetical protein